MNELILTQDLVFVDQNEIYTDSYKIAREFKKEHKNVIRAIEDMAKRLNRYDMYQRDLLTYNIEKDNASNNGRGLCRWKNIKPVLEAKLLEHEKELQPDWIDQLDKNKYYVKK